MSPSRRYDPLSDDVKLLVVDLHKEHPNLGHSGLLQALKDEGHEIDPQRLEEFLDHNGIEGERWRHLPNSSRRWAYLYGWGGLALMDTGDGDD